MNRNALSVIAVVLVVASAVLAQVTNDPFPTPIPATEGVIAVKFAEFATIPSSTANNAAPRIMTMLHEPGTQRYFASDMIGKLYAISADGKTVTPYLDLTAAGAWAFRLKTRSGAFKASPSILSSTSAARGALGSSTP